MEQFKQDVVLRMAGTTPQEVDAIHRYINLLGQYQKMAEGSYNISKEKLKELLDNKTLEAVLAEDEGEPSGIGLFYTLASGFSGKTSMFLNIFFVEEEKRFLGIGKKIIKYLSQIALDRNYERIEWLCLDWNEASMKFYRGIESKEIDTVTTFRLMPDDMKRLVSKF